MNILKFKRILKYWSITGSLIESLYVQETNKKILFHRNLDSLIKENYEEILENRYADNLPSILDTLYENGSFKEFIKEKMLYTLTIASNQEMAIILKKDYGFDWKEYIESNIDDVLKKLSCEKVQKIILVSSKFSSTVKKKINVYLESEKEKYIEYLLFGKLKEYTDQEQYKTLIFLLVKLIEEILKHENKTYFDIKKRQSGHYSDVIEIGEKIIKLGRNRVTYEIPYDRRILMPIIRVDLSKVSEIKAVLEVTEKVNSDIKIQKDSLCDLYKEIRNRKIICTDMREENVGILLKNNKIHWRYPLCAEINTRGIVGKVEEEILDIGDYVILDLDYIYKENAEKITWPNLEAKDFEESYQEEKIKKLTKSKKNTN